MLIERSGWTRRGGAPRRCWPSRRSSGRSRTLYRLQRSQMPGSLPVRGPEPAIYGTLGTSTYQSPQAQHRSGSVNTTTARCWPTSVSEGRTWTLDRAASPDRSTSVLLRQSLPSHRLPPGPSTIQVRPTQPAMVRSCGARLVSSPTTRIGSPCASEVDASPSGPVTRTRYCTLPFGHSSGHWPLGRDRRQVEQVWSSGETAGSGPTCPHPHRNATAAVDARRLKRAPTPCRSPAARDRAWPPAPSRPARPAPRGRAPRPATRSPPTPSGARSPSV